MSKNSKKNTQTDNRGIAATAVDLAVGGAVLAADKAAELIDDAIDRGSEALSEAGETVRDAVSAVAGSADDAATEAVNQGREVAASVQTAAQDAVAAATPRRDTSPYETRSKEELYELAQERNIEGRSSMSKEDLIEALRGS